MQRVHLLTPSVLPGDAVSTDILGMRRWLRKRGIAVRVYAGRRHPRLRRLVRPLPRYYHFLEEPDDVLIYHHSVGWPAGLAAYEASRNRKVLRYHNVTPAVYYRPYDGKYLKACRQGVRETRRLLQAGAEVFLADSEFNAHELRALGGDAALCRTVPPFHAIDRLASLPSRPRPATRLGQHPYLLFIGRLAPNKGHRHLLQAFAWYRHFLGGQARLLLVGPYDPGLVHYRRELEEQIRRLRLAGLVRFISKVSNAALRALYEQASVFVCASEHEGFCVPLVEAMYFGVPIVAYGGSAVGYTLGNAGLAWPTPAPALLAESIRLIEEQPQARAALIASQRERFETQFRIEAIGARFEEALTSVLAGCVKSAQTHRRGGAGAPVRT
jgi:glycosyltransferase involved in cell wall biosynthesis